MSAIFAVMARATAHRPANYMDRIYGPAYRRREVRVIYGVRLAFVAFGAFALTSSFVGPDAMPFNTVRGGFLLFQILFIAFLMAFVLIKPVQGTSSYPGAPRNASAGSSGIALSLALLIAAPILRGGDHNPRRAITFGNREGDYPCRVLRNIHAVFS